MKVAKLVLAQFMNRTNAETKLFLKIRKVVTHAKTES